jgi:phage terminase Nu1 subunit (DNA packaging protein)
MKPGKRGKRARHEAAPSLLTAKQLQEQLGIAERTFQRMVQNGLEAAVPGKGAKPALYEPMQVAVYLRQSVDDSGSGEGDAWMDGAPGSSPHLEAYRKEKARAEKRKNDLAEKRIVDVGEVHVMIDAIFAALATELEALQRSVPLLGNALLDALQRANAKALEVLPPKPEAPASAQGELL